MTGLLPAVLDAFGRPGWRMIARPSQIEPAGDWLVWVLSGGRGSGKTRAGVEWLVGRAMASPGGRTLMVGRTGRDVVDILLHGPSGVLAVSPDWFRPEWHPTRQVVDWPNGHVTHVRSADEPEGLTGLEVSAALLDEYASWERPKDALETLELGLRAKGAGGRIRYVVTTTPRRAGRLPEWWERAKRGDPLVRLSVMSTYENAANLSPEFIRDVVDPLRGTRQAREQVEGELILEAEGALWTAATIEASRLPVRPRDVALDVVIGVDPAAGAAGTTGIVAAGADRASPRHAYILGDFSASGRPEEWGRAAVACAREFGTNIFIVESNQGGLMAAAVIRAVEPRATVKLVHAAADKATRAAPVAAMWERGLVHVVGRLPKLEDELTGWAPGSSESPNRLDAAVHAVTHLVPSLVFDPDAAQYIPPAAASVQRYGGPEGRWGKVSTSGVGQNDGSGISGGHTRW